MKLLTLCTGLLWLGAQGYQAQKMSEKEFKESRLLGDQIDFVERNVLNMLRLGMFPQLYNSSWPLLKTCGCYYTPTKIIFGTGIGLQCQRLWMDEGPPAYDADECGEICNDPHGVDIVMMCPAGWEQDCSRGCYPPDEFGTVENRVDFWELTLTSLLIHGSDYIAVTPQYLKECACSGKIRPIKYGTQVGFDCIMEKDKEPSDRCSAARNCVDANENRLITFCPAGHRATCAGCEKVIAEDTLQARLEWMINVITGYAQESLELLGWKPSTDRMLACACMDSVEPVQYGKRLGFYCPISDVDKITTDCGPNTLCKDSEGRSLLHFCPDGFTPSCDEGCSFPWKGKEEL